MEAAASLPRPLTREDVAVIIPAYGDGRLLQNCLRALNDAEIPGETIIWDNGILGRPSIEIQGHTLYLKGDGNLGFAKACNQAAKNTSRPILVFLNVDTEVEPGWLDPLVAAIELPFVGAAGSRLHHPDGTLQHAGVRIVLAETAWGEEVKVDTESGEVDGVTGACMAVDAALFDALGGFDEDFRNGYEDVDLCIRIQRAGYKILYAAESRVMHHEHATGPERWRHAQHNVDLLQKKWATG